MGTDSPGLHICAVEPVKERREGERVGGREEGRERGREGQRAGREGGKQKEEEKKSRNELDTSGVGHTPVIHTLGRLRQEDFKFEASLG